MSYRYWKVSADGSAEEGTNQAGLLDTIKNLGQAIINSLLLLFAITIMTCLIAPIVAYFLIFKLLREVFTHDYFETIEVTPSWARARDSSGRYVADGKSTVNVKEAYKDCRTPIDS